jgi:Ohr subfamily peroxiredoxin
VRIPKEMGGPGGATNPEELFAAGYAACFHSALKLVGGREKLDVTGTAVTAAVSIGALPDGGFGLSVELSVHAPNLDHDTALALVEKAHQVCPYSNATRGNIEVALSVV